MQQHLPLVRYLHVSGLSGLFHLFVDLPSRPGQEEARSPPRGAPGDLLASRTSASFAHGVPWCPMESLCQAEQKPPAPCEEAKGFKMLKGLQGFKDHRPSRQAS